MKKLKQKIYVLVHGYTYGFFEFTSPSRPTTTPVYVCTHAQCVYNIMYSLKVFSNYIAVMYLNPMTRSCAVELNAL